LNIRYSGHPVYAGYYVEAINGFGEFDAGELSGWMYRVNGVFPGYSSSLHELKDGDSVEWVYTRDLGSDVGGGYSVGGNGTSGDDSGGSDGSEIKTTETVSGGTVKVEVTPEDVNAAIGKAKEERSDSVTVTVAAVGTTAEVSMSKSSLKTIADNGLKYTVKSSVGEVTFGKDVLQTIASKSGEKVEVVISNDGKTEAVSAENKTFTLTVKVGGEELRELGGEAEVALPYAKSADEDSELLTVYKLNDDGTFEEIDGAKYDTTSGKAKFAASETGAYFVAEWISPFEDVEKGEWYYKSVRFAYSNGLVNGTDVGFEPQTTLTRAMLVTILAREAGADTSGSGSEWYAKAVEWGVTNGVTDGSEPNGEVTREQFAVMLYRYSGEPGAGANLGAYSDSGEISDWAANAMAWAVGKGLINGRTLTTLEPSGTATRAEAATLLQRWLQNAAG
jgi:hypothetical protein